MDLPHDSDATFDHNPRAQQVYSFCLDIAAEIERDFDSELGIQIYRKQRHYNFTHITKASCRKITMNDWRVKFVADIQRATIEDLQARDNFQAQWTFPNSRCFMRKERLMLVQLLGLKHEFDTSTIIPCTVFDVKTTEILQLTHPIMDELVKFINHYYFRVPEADPWKEAEKRTTLILDTYGGKLVREPDESNYRLQIDPNVMELFDNSDYWRHGWVDKWARPPRGATAESESDEAEDEAEDSASEEAEETDDTGMA